MLNIVLVEPEIASNTGNVARTCACIGAKLHLVYPLGFQLSDKKVKRSGLDYWDKVEVKRWRSLEEFVDNISNTSAFPKNMHLFTGRCKNSLFKTHFKDSDYLIFGRETAGLPIYFMKKYKNECVRIPMLDNLRSLNLSNSVAIAAYEAIRQIDYTDLI